MTSTQPATAATSLFTFYDIESTSNVFTLTAYTPRPGGPGELEMFVLADGFDVGRDLDPAALFDAVTAANPGLPAVAARLWDLSGPEGNRRLAEMMGLSNAEQVCDPASPSDYPGEFRPVCDTDSGYDPRRHPFLVGYNSLPYDTTMLALYFAETFPAAAGRRFGQVSAAVMRRHNTALFSEEFRDRMPRYLGWDGPARIRRAMLASGRHIDAARLNESQSHVGLKRVGGMLGHQIKESDKLRHDSVITSVAQLCELLAYNVSDCLTLAHVFRDSVYSTAFDLKAGLLAQYPETVYASDGTVRADRLTIDSSSAKFVGRILCPNGSLEDIETVSFLYPHPDVAAERGITQVNVLEESRRFFYENIADPAARARFDQIYAYYRRIEGQNFNDSPEHVSRHARPAMSLADVPKAPNNLPYYDAGGRESGCFVTFSTGGIHGAEADMGAFLADLLAYEVQVNQILRARNAFGDPSALVAEARRQHRRLTLPDGTCVDKQMVLVGSDPATVRWRPPKKNDPVQTEQVARARAIEPDAAALLATGRPAEHAWHVTLPDGSRVDGKTVLANTSLKSAAYRDPDTLPAPELFVARGDGSTRLHPKYARTSAGRVIHEDFTSYYPCLLINLKAFDNPALGEDRYARIFADRMRIKQQLTDPGLDPAERRRLDTLQKGFKLVLNAASGAGDTTFANPIRMNNLIISMRIIGQLLTWRIGQAQTLAGARIISTNTDGLHSVLDEAANNRVLAEQTAAIGIRIEPEPEFIVTKDSNNRITLTPPPTASGVVDEARPLTDWQIDTTAGGTLACHTGPRPDKSLAHPAVLDHALARYLQALAARGEEALSREFDPDLASTLITEALESRDQLAAALLFQNIVTASPGSITYPFATRLASPDESDDDLDDDSDDDCADRGVVAGARPLQLVNRVFVVRPGTPGAVSLRAAVARKVPTARLTRRRSAGLAVVERDPTALRILAHHGWTPGRYQAARDGLALLPADQDVTVRRVVGIDPAWPILIRNDSLHTLPAGELTRLLKALDLDVYTQMLAETYTNNWKNSPHQAGGLP